VTAGSASRRQRTWCLAGTAVTLLVAGEAVVLIRHLEGHPPGNPVWVFGLAYLSSWVAVGLVIALRVPENRLGPLIQVLAVFGGLQVLGSAVAPTFGSHATPGVDLFTALSGFGQVVGVAGWLMIVPHLLPTGEPVSRRWALALYAAVAGVALTALGQATTDSGVRQTLDYARTPVRLTSPLGPVVNGVGNVLLVVGLITGVASLVVRWRRGTAETRQQLKWLVLAAVTVLALYLVQGFVHSSIPDWLGVILWLVVAAALPAAIAAAILRYRLYDIDRLISRTVSYTTVTAVLAGAYIALVATATRLLPVSSSISVAASTLAVAALFNPVRRSVQRRVDHRFNRSRYDATRAVEGFSSRLRDELDIVTVQSDLLKVVTTTLQPTHTSVWLRRAT